MIYQIVQLLKGKITFNKESFREKIANAFDGKYLMVLIRYPDKSQRDWQNYYYFVIGQWAISQGWTKSDLHDLIKLELFDSLFDGEVTSTNDLSLEQWKILFFNLENFLHRKFENS